MWLLVLVFLQTIPGVDRLTMIEPYPTLEECRIERNRVGFEMAEAYPYEREFVIECRPSACRGRDARTCAHARQPALRRLRG